MFPTESSSDSSTSVLVAVRVRPLDARERLRNSACIVEMNESQSTYISNPKHPGEDKKRFDFDYSFWSFDERDPHYVDQDKIYDCIGLPAIDNAWMGYNVSLFAYGQTGSGKSYTMVGYQGDPGIIPRVCEDLFRRIEVADSSEDISVSCSMLEIYNESVRDLLHINSRGVGMGPGLRIREHPRTGPYVEGLSNLVVEDYADIEKLLKEGSQARTIAKTNMNETSSRAHTIFQIIVTKSKEDEIVKKRTSTVSKISLVDLAGSERSSTAGVTGDRLKEGCSINQSLSCLGRCINKLAEISSGKSKQTFIPYRESSLTWLLRESLGGNARTIMIASISPADINYEETLSTLRYAQSAKLIRTFAVINEDPNARLIRELRLEIEKLRQQLGQDGNATMSQNPLEEVSRLREQLKESQRLIQELQMTAEERKAVTQAINQERERILQGAGIRLSDLVGADQKTTPHMVNLNEDPLMSECLVYFVQEGETVLGSVDPESCADIELSGSNVAPKHCKLVRTGDRVTLIPLVPENSRFKTYVNGEMIHVEMELHQSDRIIIGSSHYFRFMHPVEAQRMKEEGKDLSSAHLLDYRFAVREFMKTQGFLDTEEIEKHIALEAERTRKALEEEHLRRREDLESKLREQEIELARREDEMKQRLEALDQTQAQEIDIENERKEVYASILEKKNEYERLKQQLAEEMEWKRRMSSYKDEDRRVKIAIEERLSQLIPLVNQANDWAMDLERPVKFITRISFDTKEISRLLVNDSSTRSSGNLAGFHRQSAHPVVQVHSRLDSTFSVWGEGKFFNRYYIMQEVYQRAILARREHTGYVLSIDADPFYDPPEPQKIGFSMLLLSSLAYQFNSFLSVPILDLSGAEHGILNAEIYPVDSVDEPISDPVDSPDDLVNGSLRFKIRIISIENLSTPFSSDVFILYSLFDRHCRSQVNLGETHSCRFEYEETFVIERVTPQIIRFLQEDALSVEVFGNAHDIVTPPELSIHPELVRERPSMLEYSLIDFQAEIDECIAEMKNMEPEEFAMIEEENAVEEMAVAVEKISSDEFNHAGSEIIAGLSSIASSTDDGSSCQELPYVESEVLSQTVDVCSEESPMAVAKESEEKEDGNPTQLVESQTEPSSHGTPTRIELERERERNRLLEEEIRRLQEHMRFQSADPVETTVAAEDSRATSPLDSKTSVDNSEQLQVSSLESLQRSRSCLIL